MVPAGDVHVLAAGFDVFYAAGPALKPLEGHAYGSAHVYGTCVGLLEYQVFRVEINCVSGVHFA